MTTSQLLAYIFEDQSDPLAICCRLWLDDLPRFQVFAALYRDKIRKKVRNTRDSHGRANLQAELATAYLLLRERRLAVEYEKYGVGVQRGPDFSVTFKGHTRFDVEVTRLRPPGPASDGASAKLSGAICDKLGQLQPGVIALLVVVADIGAYTPEDVTGAIRSLVARAAAKDEPFFIRRGFEDSRTFLRRTQRLSAILLRHDSETQPGISLSLWLNPQARHPLPSDISAILQR